jgi:hypothetical protein
MLPAELEVETVPVVVVKACKLGIRLLVVVVVVVAAGVVELAAVPVPPQPI